MTKIRTLFLGTPDFSSKILEGLLSHNRFEIVAVVTQPDKPRGRNMKYLPSPTKALALEKGLPVWSPEKINTPESLKILAEYKAEVAIVVAYGQILSSSFLHLFEYGAVNIHGSLLPKWRGAAPIQRSLEAGENQTGVTLQKIVRELDAGDVIGTRYLSVSEEDSALDVLKAMIPLSLDLLSSDLLDFIKGYLIPQPQDSSLVTFAPKILKAECQLDWSYSSSHLHNQVRAFLMGPGAWSLFHSLRIKILKTKPHKKLLHNHSNQNPSQDLQKNLGKNLNQNHPGAVGSVFLFNSSVYVTTGEGFLEFLEVQPESKNKMTGFQWWASLESHTCYPNHLVFTQPNKTETSSYENSP
jgi:methionyl-tRNA formyltransferase